MSSLQLASKGLHTMKAKKSFSSNHVSLPMAKEKISFAEGKVEKICLLSSGVGSM
ncbi:hypothetical protein [Mammaliicoccus sciuri]|uniref:hypothetical protein n=1 Tax=Mammaliicoccus sciuri TaxID=1296 RepID=UPI001304C703|nr:hypothetical protein [Mammaliicoccus sciuri]